MLRMLKHLIWNKRSGMHLLFQTNQEQDFTVKIMMAPCDGTMMAQLIAEASYSSKGLQPKAYAAAAAAAAATVIELSRLSHFLALLLLLRSLGKLSLL